MTNAHGSIPKNAPPMRSHTKLAFYEGYIRYEVFGDRQIVAFLIVRYDSVVHDWREGERDTVSSPVLV